MRRTFHDEMLQNTINNEAHETDPCLERVFRVSSTLERFV